MGTIKNARIHVSIMSAILSVIITITLLVIILLLSKRERYPSAHNGLLVTTVTHKANPITLGPISRDKTVDSGDLESKEIKRDRLKRKIPNTDIRKIRRTSLIAPFSDKIQEPIILVAPDPVYPDTAKNDGIEGEIVLRFVVDKRGFVYKPEVVDAEPEGVFEASALSAITKYKFIPAKRNNMPVESIVYLPIKYKINESAT